MRRFSDVMRSRYVLIRLSHARARRGPFELALAASKRSPRCVTLSLHHMTCSRHPCKHDSLQLAVGHTVLHTATLSRSAAPSMVGSAAVKGGPHHGTVVHTVAKVQCCVVGDLARIHLSAVQDEPAPGSTQACGKSQPSECKRALFMYDYILKLLFASIPTQHNRPGHAEFYVRLPAGSHSASSQPLCMS